MYRDVWGKAGRAVPRYTAAPNLSARSWSRSIQLGEGDEHRREREGACLPGHGPNRGWMDGGGEVLLDVCMMDGLVEEFFLFFILFFSQLSTRRIDPRRGRRREDQKNK